MFNCNVSIITSDRVTSSDDIAAGTLRGNTYFTPLTRERENAIEAHDAKLKPLHNQRGRSKLSLSLSHSRPRPLSPSFSANI